MEEIIAVGTDEAAMSAAEAVAESEGTVQTAPKKRKHHINQQKLWDNIWGWLFCLPLIIGTCWFIYSTLIMAFLLSFTTFRTGGQVSMWECLAHMGDYIAKDLTGATNAFYWYKALFTEKVSGMDRVTLIGMGIELNEMGAYLLNTVFYMIGIPIGMILSVFFAVCMSRDIKGGNVFRVLYYLPCVASAIAIVYTFKIMFGSTGVINQLFGLGNFHWISEGVEGAYTWQNLTGAPISTNAFMMDPYWCQGFFMKLVIVIMSVWKGLGGTIILYVAGLSGVNAATKEAAQIDGANGWIIFWKVTMPDLYPTIFYNIVTSVIGGMQIYAEPEMFMNSAYSGGNVMVSGYVALIYKYGINMKYASRGAAYGMFLAVIIFVLTLFQFWLDSRKKD